MLRITLGGHGMLDFPADQAGGYIKPMFDAEPENKPLMRTYTIREERAGKMNVEFVLHGDGGPASHWAASCQTGDSIMVGGPGAKELLEAWQ